MVVLVQCALKDNGCWGEKTIEVMRRVEEFKRLYSGVGCHFKWELLIEMKWNDRLWSLLLSNHVLFPASCMWKGMQYTPCPLTVEGKKAASLVEGLFIGFVVCVKSLCLWLNDPYSSAGRQKSLRSWCKQSHSYGAAGWYLVFGWTHFYLEVSPKPCLLLSGFKPIHLCLIFMDKECWLPPPRWCVSVGSASPCLECKRGACLWCRLLIYHSPIWNLFKAFCLTHSIFVVNCSSDLVYTILMPYG